MIPTNTKPVGRPRRTQVEGLRARLWYYAVKSRTSLSDYQLDLLFLEKLGRRPKDPQMRSRIFETVRLQGSLPSRGNHPKRDFDLIQLVEEEAAFTGTAAVFYSPYWQLLTRKDLDIAVYHEIAQEAMNRLGLARTDFDGEKYMQEYWRGKHEANKPAAIRYNDCMYDLYGTLLRGALKASQPTLDGLVLLGALFREAYLACALEIAIQIKNLYCEFLAEYVSQAWLRPVSEKLQEVGEDYLIFSHAYEYMLGLNKNSSYDDTPVMVVGRPIWFADDVTMMNQSGRKMLEMWQQELLKEQGL